jgi:hypothetical protein
MASFPVPTGMAFEAIEVREDNAPGYQFNSLSSFDADQAVAKQAFIKKIREGALWTGGRP